MTTIMLFGVLAGLDNLQVVPALGMNRMRAGRRWMMAISFGLCEAVMPVLGLLIGHLVKQSLVSLAEALGPFILVGCGALIICLALKGKDTSKVVNSTWTIVGLPLSLSIDNLVAGVGLGSAGYPVLFSALVIGFISGAMCLFGLLLGDRVGKWIPEEIEILSGAYLIVIAVMKF